MKKNPPVDLHETSILGIQRLIVEFEIVSIKFKRYNVIIKVVTSSHPLGSEPTWLGSERGTNTLVGNGVETPPVGGK
jgi:hypothetical protein